MLKTTPERAIGDQSKKKGVLDQGNHTERQGTGKEEETVKWEDIKI